jgi:hypothetical protein
MIGSVLEKLEKLEISPFSSKDKTSFDSRRPPLIMQTHVLSSRRLLVSAHGLDEKAQKILT